MDILHPLPIGTHVTFNVEDLVLGTAIVIQTEHDDGWLYRLNGIEFSRGDTTLLERLVTIDAEGSAWLCEHEVRPQMEEEPHDASR